MVARSLRHENDTGRVNSLRIDLKLKSGEMVRFMLGPLVSALGLCGGGHAADGALGGESDPGVCGWRAA